MYEKYVQLKRRSKVTDAIVSRNTGIAKSTFSDWKSGRSKPKMEKLKRIADYFGVDVSYFVSERGIVMNDLNIFTNEEFGDIRTVTIDGEPWLVGKDVAEALGYANPKNVVPKYVNEEDRLSTQIEYAGQKREVTVINESGLYALIFSSKLESAKRFKRWVTSEVLPAIRKNGNYGMPTTTEGKIKLLATGHAELNEKIDSIAKDLQDFKKDMPLLALECQKITRAKNLKVVSILGGKESEAYKDNSIRGKVYRDIDSQLRREFGVNTYKAIKRNQCDFAVEIINRYELPFTLCEEVRLANAQMRFGSC